jgi:hypothetical protein
MAMRIPGPKKPEAGTLLGNATSVSPEWYSIPKPASPNWRKWSNMATVELWEAIALSLNIEPVCDLQGTSPDFYSRMEIAVSHLRTGGALEAVERNPRLHCTRVRLGDVANLAASCVPAWVLPVEFPNRLTATVSMQVETKSPRTRTDNLSKAMEIGFTSYKRRFNSEPTARGLFDWLATNDETGKITELDAENDVLTWTRSDGGLSDTSFKSFQGRFTKMKRKKS